MPFLTETFQPCYIINYAIFNFYLLRTYISGPVFTFVDQSVAVMTWDVRYALYWFNIFRNKWGSKFIALFCYIIPKMGNVFFNRNVDRERSGSVRIVVASNKRRLVARLVYLTGTFLISRVNFLPSFRLGSYLY